MPSSRDKISGRFDYPKPAPLSFKGGVSRTQQQFKTDADINVIVARARKTGFLVDPSIARSRAPQFGDFTLVPDFHQQQAQIAQATQEFMRLPALVRERFKNDVGLFMDFIGDDANLEEAVKLGLLPESRLPKKSEAERRGEGKATHPEPVDDQELTAEEDIEEVPRKRNPVVPSRSSVGSSAERGKSASKGR